MQFVKRNLAVILVILAAMLMIAIAIRVFDKRIEDLEKKNSGKTRLLNQHNRLSLCAAVKTQEIKLEYFVNPETI